LEKALRQKTWWKVGGTHGFIYGMAKRSCPQIVVHITRNLEGGEVSLTKLSSGRLEFKLSCIRLTGSVELRSGCCSGLVLFDQSCRMDRLLTVNSCIKVRLDLQADKSSVVVKGPFFPRVVNPRYRIRGTNVWRKRWSSKAKQLQSSIKRNPNASR
jgi:hypothetical protein